MSSTIGIVGGVGPAAGLDLCSKITSNTLANCDQDHLNFLLGSYPGEITDRTEFLLGHTDLNPAYALAEVIKLLDTAGCKVAGIPCNTAHAQPIFSEITECMKRDGCQIRLLHMIQEVANFLRRLGGIQTVGVLSTTGSWKTRVYPDVLEPLGFSVVVPSERTQFEAVHEAIYDRSYGVKAQANPVSDRAKQAFALAIEELKANGAQAVILGCTEIPLAITEETVSGLRMIDPSNVLARALIRETAPDKLTPL